MAKKKIEILSEDSEQPQLSEADMRRIIEKNEKVHLAIAVLVHGKTYATTRFPHYSGFLTKLRVAYENKDAQSFLFCLEIYFEHARKYIPQVPVKKKTDEIMGEMRRLVGLYGVQPVATCILARMVG
jgi:hypothetical protein